MPIYVLVLIEDMATIWFVAFVDSGRTVIVSCSADGGHFGVGEAFDAAGTGRSLHWTG